MDFRVRRYDLNIKTEMAKIDYRLVTFVKSGVIEGLILGDALPSNRKKWLSSVDAHPNGKSRLYQCTINKLTMSIGATEDDRVAYIVVHLNKQDSVHSLILNGEILEWRKLTLDQLIRYLVENELSWRFSTTWERVVTLSLDHNHIEFVFSFFPDEVGLQMIQVAEKLDEKFAVVTTCDKGTKDHEGNLKEH